jgi:putative drug exporter of the RND superfamily
MIDRLCTLSLRASRIVIGAWLALFVVGVVAAGGLFSSLEADLDGPAGAESEVVGRRLDALDPSGSTVVAVVEGEWRGDEVVARLRDTPGVADVATLPSVDGGATGIAVELDAGLGEDPHDALVDDVEQTLRSIDAHRVLVGGEELLDDEVAELAERDAQRAELLSLPVALVVMAVVFGGVLAAGLPLAIALGGVGGTMIVLGVAAELTDVSIYAVNVAMMLGIGLGIDYGLLIVTRYREELATSDEELVGHGRDDAIRRTMATAGRTVVFSACTVGAALVGLLVFEDPTMRSLGIAGIGVVLCTMTAALTLLPALLHRSGHRLRPQAAPSDHGYFARTARAIQRRALPVAALVAVTLALLGTPFLHARFDDAGAKVLPRSSETRQVAEAIDARFPQVAAEPIEVVADVARDAPALGAWLGEVRALDGVFDATVQGSSTETTTVVTVRPVGPTNGADAQRLVGAVRALDAPFAVAVGGDPAEIVDLRDSLADRLPLALAIIAVATFALLFLMTGSVVLPIKAIAMNVLSLGATFGALVVIFQDGHLAGALGFDAPGSLDLMMSVIVFVFAFGLSMDYEVFLLARIKEAWDETGDNDHAVAVGLQRCGRIITSAALLIVIVFAGFAAGEIVAMKQLGIGLAIAVIVDATIVRALLVPATMDLLGRWNWWSPRPLARLHQRYGWHEGVSARRPGPPRTPASRSA